MESARWGEAGLRISWLSGQGWGFHRAASKTVVSVVQEGDRFFQLPYGWIVDPVSRHNRQYLSPERHGVQRGLPSINESIGLARKAFCAVFGGFELEGGGLVDGKHS